MTRSGGERRRAKLSATVDAELLEAVDRFLQEHPDMNRSVIIDQALRLWTAQERERAMEAQYHGPLSPEECEERAAWKKLRRSATTARLFRSR